VGDRPLEVGGYAGRGLIFAGKNIFLKIMLIKIADIRNI
jgi:hypothetical protein